jgi:hypothetical protein
MEIVPAIEALGFDFALLGVLVTTAVTLAILLVRRTHLMPWEAVKQGTQTILHRLRDATGSELIVWAVLTALLGMVGNVGADLLFDKAAVRPLFEDRDLTEGAALESCVELESSWPRLRTEDAIKQDAVRDVCRRADQGSPARALLTSHASVAGAKQLTQVATALVQESGSGPTNASLRLEFMVVKVSRVLILAFTILGLAAMVRLALAFRAKLESASPADSRAPALEPAAAAATGPSPAPTARQSDGSAPVSAAVMEVIGAAIREQMGPDAHAAADAAPVAVGPGAGRSDWTLARGNVLSAEPISQQHRIVHALACAGIVAVCTLVAALFTALWAEQSLRYYKKLFYSYLVEKDLSTAAPPQGAPAGIPTFNGLDEIPGTEARLSHVNRPNADGDVSMYEFSGITQAGNHILVIDNETNTLAADRWRQAFFDVALRPRGSEPPLSVTRSWPDAFAQLPEQWDDIEGVTSRTTAVFAIGSHALNSDGLLRADRRVLMRLRLAPSGEPESGAEIYRGLTGALNTVLESAGLTTSAAATAPGAAAETIIKDLNIEGLAFAPDSPSDLLLGLRAPLVPAPTGARESALVLRLAAVDRLFDVPQTAPVITIEKQLALNGRGIAALEYDTKTDGFLVASAPANETDPLDYSSLWRWRPKVRDEQPKELMRFQGHKLEGIGRVVLDGTDYVLLAFDEERRVRVQGTSTLRREQFGTLLLVNYQPQSWLREQIGK